MRKSKISLICFLFILSGFSVLLSERRSISPTELTDNLPATLTTENFSPQISSIRSERLTSEGRPLDGDPVDLSTGLYILEDNDIFVIGSPIIVFTRTYRNRDSESRAFGIGANHPYNLYLTGEPIRHIDLILADGGRIRYHRISGTRQADSVYEHVTTPTKFFKSRLTWNGKGWSINLQDGSQYSFMACDEKELCLLILYRDSLGHELHIERDAARNAIGISTLSSKGILLKYDSHNRIIRARTSWGRVIQKLDYEYDEHGRLKKVRHFYLDLLGPFIYLVSRAAGIPIPLEYWWQNISKEYAYDDSHQMITIQEPGIFMRNLYDEQGRVVKQILTNGKAFEFTYKVDIKNKIIGTDVKGPDGSLRRVTFNSDGYAMTDTYLVDEPKQYAILYNRIPGNQVIDLTIKCMSGGSKIIVTAPVGEEPATDVEHRLLKKCDQ